VLRVADDSQTVVLRVGAGRHWHALVSECLDAGLYGLENLALIPGSVGAAPVQNIGAYGAELEQFVVAVHGLEVETLRGRVLNKGECEFAYRQSVFKAALAGRFIITAVDLRLSRDPVVNTQYPALAERLARFPGPVTPRAVFDAVVALRRERLPDPARDPNAGSFFKNPLVPRTEALALQAANPGLPVFAADADRAKLSAAWMIDACGFRGAQRDGVAVSADHALVLVHRGGGQSRLLALASEIAAAVKARFGCELEIEPVVYGDD
jgi:UDP-N-acetylmuramate dehydrogenase